MSSPPPQSAPRDFREDGEPGSKRFGYTEDDLNTSKSIFFGHLPGDMTEEELRTDMLGQYTIESVKMGVPKKGPEGTKYAFVAFGSREEAKEAFDRFVGQSWRDFPLKIDWDIGQDRKQEINRRVGYGQHRDRGHSRGYGGRRERGGGYSSRYGSRRPSYGYRSSRYAPYGGDDYYDRPPRYDSYGYRGGYDSKFSPPRQDYYGGGYDRYESRSYHRDEHRGGGHHDRYAHAPSDVAPHHPPSDYDRYPSDTYGGSHADSYRRHSPPPHRGGGDSYRDQGYQSRDYGHESHGGRDTYAHQDTGRDYPADSGYEYPARDQEASYGDRA